MRLFHIRRVSTKEASQVYLAQIIRPNLSTQHPFTLLFTATEIMAASTSYNARPVGGRTRQRQRSKEAKEAAAAAAAAAAQAKAAESHHHVVKSPKHKAGKHHAGKVTKTAPQPPPYTKKKKEQDGLCKDGAQKIVEPVIAQLDDVIANKGDWCDGNHFAPARALLKSWLDEKTGTEPTAPQQLNKFAAKTTFIDPIIGHLTFLAANKDWCDGGRFGEARESLEAWVSASTQEQLCKGGALNAINAIIEELEILIYTKGSWCDGNIFVPAIDLLIEWAVEQELPLQSGTEDYTSEFPDDMPYCTGMTSGCG